MVEPLCVHGVRVVECDACWKPSVPAPEPDPTRKLRVERERPPFHVIYLRHARDWAERATCHRLRVGCVITSADFAEVYGVGYNGSAAGLPNGCVRDTPGNCGCFVSGTRVRAARVQRAYRRWYVGDVVRVVTRHGEFAATPHHPVLAAGRGWVAAEALREGDHLLGPRWAEGVPPRGPDDQQGVPIEQVFEALRVAGGVVRRAGARHDFHGDGLADQDVDVVAVHGGLAPHAQPGVLQFGGQPGFAAALAVPPAFRGARASSQLVLAVGDQPGFQQAVAYHDAPDAVGAGQGAGGLARLVTGQKLPQWELDHGLALVPAERLGRRAQHPAFAQTVLDRGVGDAQRAGDLQDGLAGLVAAHEVVAVERYGWAGHVYNLQTAGNWYELAGPSVVAHNCLHAEDNACTKSGRRGGLPKFVFCTDQPCEACAQRFVNLTGVQRVYYVRPYRLEDGLRVLERASIQVVRVPEEKLTW